MAKFTSLYSHNMRVRVFQRLLLTFYTDINIFVIVENTALIVNKNDNEKSQIKKNK